MTKVKSKKEVILHAQNKQRTVHYATLMDICHLKNAELDPEFQKYKGWVILRGVIVKDDSGSCAVFTEQGSSASHMSAACLARFKTLGTKKPVAKTSPILVDQCTHGSWKPTNPRESALQRLNKKIVKTTLPGRVQFEESLQSCAQVYSCAPSNENTGC